MNLKKCPKCNGEGFFVKKEQPIGCLRCKGEGKVKKINSRNKGACAEREFANLLKENGFEARRGVQYQGGSESPDVVSELPIHWEIKAVQNINLHTVMKKLIKECPTGKWRAIAHKRNASGWIVAMPVEDFVDIMKERFNR